MLHIPVDSWNSINNFGMEPWKKTLQGDTCCESHWHETQQLLRKKHHPRESSHCSAAHVFYSLDSKKKFKFNSDNISE